MKARWILPLAFLLFLTSPSLLGQGASENLEKEARTAFKAGRFKEAALKFEDSAATAAEPERRGRMELQAGWSHFNDKNQRLAREALKRAFQADSKLDVIPEFFSPEFVSLTKDVQKAVQAGSAPPVAPVPVAPPVAPVTRPGAALSLPDLLANGRSALERGDAHQAQGFANQAILLDPSSSDAYRLLGDSFFAKADGSLAEANWKKSLQLNPSNEGTLSSLAEYYLAEKNWDTALLQMKKLAELNGATHGEKLLRLAREVRKAGDLERARQIYSTAATAMPENALVLNEFAALLFQQKDYDSAFEPLEKAERLDPRNAVISTNLAALYRMRDLTSDAAARYRRGLENNPGYIPALNGLASLMLTTGQSKEAADFFQRALGRNPRDPDALVGMARAKRLQGDLAGAAQTLEPGAILDDPDLWNEAGAIAYERGRFPEAVSFFDKALAKRPSFSTAKSNREKAQAAAEFIKTLGS